MAITQKGAISFGLVYIPVDLYAATKDNSIGFNQLHKDDMARVRYKKVCSECGKELAPEDIVRGYEYSKDQYVIISDDEIEKIKTEKDRTITILSFTDLEDINPLYYDKAYHVAPQKGGGKALELLRQAMIRSDKAAVGKSVLGSSEKLLVIIPREDGLLIETLLYQDDIKELNIRYEQPAVSQAELDMAIKLIEGMEEPFKPENFKDEFREKLKKLIADKIAGKETVSPKEEKPGAVLDLMEALKASVKNTQKKPAPPKKQARVKTKKEA